MNNLVLLTDSYKLTHWKQYPPKTSVVYSYFESRGGRFQQTTFFGLQYFLKHYLAGMRITRTMIEEAEQVVAQHLGNAAFFNKAGWMHILEKHNGWLPVSIRAVPEGSTQKVLTPLMTIENTDPECFWLTNYLETLLVQMWYPITVATQSREIKRRILAFLDETGDPAGIGFKLHDFGFRGVSSVESAGIGGLAHLLNFVGTDNLEALTMGRKYYASDMAGFSIPAAEHSTITAWGADSEREAFKNMLTQYPTGLMACVSDSYDIYRACEQYWGKDLKDQVLARDGVLVVRPDSGQPEEVVVKVLDSLERGFGSTENAKGFKVLNPKVRIIQGDGVNYDSIGDILGNMKVNGWSADNIAFGMGGALLQTLNRDTQMFAFKCSSVTVDGKERDVYKKPVTESWKVSKAGRFNVGEEIFRDGKVLKTYTLDECRKLSNE